MRPRVVAAFFLRARLPIDQHVTRTGFRPRMLAHSGETIRGLAVAAAHVIAPGPPEARGIRGFARWMPCDQAPIFSPCEIVLIVFFKDAADSKHRTRRQVALGESCD